MYHINASVIHGRHLSLPDFLVNEQMHFLIMTLLSYAMDDRNIPSDRARDRDDNTSIRLFLLIGMESDLICNNLSCRYGIIERDGTPCFFCLRKFLLDRAVVVSSTQFKFV